MKPIKAMLPQMTVLALTVCILAAPTSGALEINKRTGPSPSEQVKINKAITKSYLLRGVGANGNGKQGDLQGCGNTRLGNVQAPKASRIDNVTVVRGDVINVNRNLRCK